MAFKLRYKKDKIGTAADAVAYTGLFLTGWVLEWFELYMNKYYQNGATTTHLETKYIFTRWDNFMNQLTQMFRDLEEVVIAEQQLENLTQKGAVTEYTTQF